MKPGENVKEPFETKTDLGMRKGRLQTEEPVSPYSQCTASTRLQQSGPP